METLNFAKGYDKVKNPSTPSLESPNSPSTNNKTRKTKTITIITIATLLLTLAICSLIAALIHESSTEPSKQSDSSPVPLETNTNTTKTLITICSITLHPNTCFTSISPLLTNTTPPPISPLHFFNLSLLASLTELTTLKSHLPNEPNTNPAINDCTELFDDAASQLAKSTEVLGGKYALNETQVSDLKTWISAAMTDQETCLDGLEETGSTGFVEFKVKVEKCQEYMSNSLAILGNIDTLYQKLGLKMP